MKKHPKLTTPLAQPVFDEPIFNEGKFIPDPNKFKTKHPSDSALYKQLGNALLKKIVTFQASRLNPQEVYALSNALGPHGNEIIKNIENNGQIIFHVAGDTGCSNEGKYQNEIRVSDQVTKDFATADISDRPSFFYHLGDLVYNFGESKYYYDEFYDPFRNYPGPIFAIPGNHDSFIVPGTPQSNLPLEVFMRNFCAKRPGITPEAASLHRTAMTQPGVYYTLDAPFVRIIGLFSNALEDPGVISSENGRWPGIPDIQLDFLTKQLNRIIKEKYPGAVLLATHHPPFSYAASTPVHGYGGIHGCSPAMLRDIDKICSNAGFYPHAIVSGHAHNYQRYTRIINFEKSEIEVPFIVCGSGGHNINPLVMGKDGKAEEQPPFGKQVEYLESKPVVEVKGLVLEKYDDRNYGYLRVRVDQKQLVINFHQAQNNIPLQSHFDTVTVNLTSHKIV